MDEEAEAQGGRVSRGWEIAVSKTVKVFMEFQT